MDKRALFRQHFFKYISKADFAIGISTIFGTIATTVVSSYSSYLSDRNARIERINKKPLNYIYVDYIEFDEYAKMIDRRNWKPVSEKISNEQQAKQNEEEKKTINYKKNEIIKTINSWLINKTKKEQQNKSEIDDESLKQLAEINGKAIDAIKTNVINKENYPDKKEDDNNNKLTIVNKNSNIGVSKISEITGKFNQKNLPPSKKKQEPVKYFVVQQGNSLLRYDPKTYRKSGKKQNINSLPQDKKTIGKIGNKEIKKDESIFESLYNLWSAILYKKEPKRYGRVIHSGYDQYGNKIVDKNSYSSTSSNKSFVKKNDKQDNDQQTDDIVFFTPSFVIDGSIAKINTDANIQQQFINKQISKNDLEIIMYLEYEIEKCWYNQYTNRKYKNVESIFTIEYTHDFLVKSIKMNYIDNLITEDEKQQFLKTFVKIINNCDISQTKNISKDNYNIWGKIKLEIK